MSVADLATIGTEATRFGECERERADGIVRTLDDFFDAWRAAVTP